uniref:Chromosome X open reading frame 38 n=1 Tax=Monodelphis domestica TaxID=13616 RepID=F6UI20_MONDO
MVLSELALRLNSAEYKNWVKAGHCLLLLRGCLQDFIRAEVEAFHRLILAATPSLGPRASCLGSVRCTPRARQFQPQCQLCTEWKREILKHHTNRNGDIYWGNCKPERWPFDPWELAKAFMPRGLADKKGPEECDAVALLSLINSCDHFRIDRKKVIEVIKCRNEIMHSSEMKVSSSWLQDFQMKIQSFLNEFRNIPEIAATSARIEKLLTFDWAVHIPGDDQLDGPKSDTKIYLSESEISEIEMELLREKLQESYLQAEGQAIPPEEVAKHVEAMKIFLKNNKDLGSSFEEEMQKLEDFHLQHQTVRAEEAGKGRLKEFL